MDMIKHSLLSLLVFMLWMEGLTVGNDVQQDSTLWEKEGGDATIKCSHSKDHGHSQMYWYRQRPGQMMQLVVFTMTGKQVHDFGDFSTEKFSATKPDYQNGTFTVRKLVAADNGLYFCAVSQHSDTDTWES